MKHEPIKALTALFALGVLLSLLATPTLAETAASREQGVAADETAAEAAAEAAVDEWLVDEERGERYKLEKLPKVKGTFKWIDDKMVLFPAGVQLEVVRHDDQFFWVKSYERYYNIKERMQKKRERAQKGPTSEDLTKAAAAYEVALKTVDRLSFEDFGKGLPQRGQWRNGFDVEDMNGDGHQDIVFGPYRKGSAHPNIFLGDSQGNWRSWREVRFPPQPYDYGDAEAGDFNGDGHMDLAFGIHLRGMLVLISDGESGFVPWTEGIVLNQPGRGGAGVGGFSSRAIDSIDWNQDGKLDLLALGEGPKAQSARGTRQVVGDARGLLVYLNGGDGTWEPYRPLTAEARMKSGFGDDFAFGDLNGDEHVDVITSSRQMSSTSILYTGIGGGQLKLEDFTPARVGGLVTTVEMADLNSDGHTDVVVGYLNRELEVWRTGIDVVYGGPEMSWERRPLFAEESRRNVTSLGVGNLDGDDHPDLVALTGQGEVMIFLGDGDGFFSLEDETLTVAAKGCNGYGLHMVDLDDDGQDELMASFAGESTGFPGIPGLSFPGCKREGSVRVWKPTPKS